MAKQEEEARRAKEEQDARKIEELKIKEAENASILKERKEALIRAREKKFQELKHKLEANTRNLSEDASQIITKAIEDKKPEPVKVMEAKFFICEKLGTKLVMQYSSELSDTSEARGKPDHIELIPSHNGNYEVGSGSFLNKREISGIEIKYPTISQSKPIKVLPSDIKSYDEIAPNLDMFYLALLCWNPNKQKTDVFAKENFDLDGFHYKGMEQFESDSGMWKFESTLDNEFVGEVLSELSGEVSSVE